MFKKYMFGAVMVFIAGAAFAQQPPSGQGRAESLLTQTLISLKESVAQLSLQNEELARTNTQMNARIKMLNDELRSAQAAEAKALEKFNTLEPVYNKKIDAVRQMEARIMQLDMAIAAVEVERVAMAGSVAEKERVDRALTESAETLELDISGLNNAGDAGDIEAELAGLRTQKEKLESEAKTSTDALAVAREEWLTLRGITEGGPSKAEALKAERATLTEQVQLREGLIKEISAAVNEQEVFISKFSSSGVANEREVKDLERDISVLSDKFRVLSRDVAKVDKERQERTRKIEQQRQKDLDKAQTKKADLELQNKALREEHDRLRKDMIALDKKKSQLETRVYGK